jgi:hypothetical protein
MPAEVAIAEGSIVKIPRANSSALLRTPHPLAGQ